MPYTYPITLAGGSVTPPGLIAAGQMILFTYDGSNWQLAEATVASYLTVDQFGAVGDGSTPDDGAVNAAAMAGTVVFNSGKTYYLATNHSFMTQAVFAPGSAIKLALGVTVTFHTPPQAGPSYIFQGTGTGGGTVNVSGPVRVDWYGALANGSDDSAAILLAAVQPSFIFSAGKTYTINTSPTYTSQAVFEVGSAISVGTGDTVTFDLPPQSGPFYIFQGSGTVKVTGPVRVDWYGALANGSDDSVAIDHAALQPAFIFSSGKIYTINSGPTYLTQAVFEAGSAISVVGGLTHNVTFQRPPIAGPFNIFQPIITSTGTVTVSGPVLAEWYGAIGDGSTNDGRAINLAWASSPAVLLSDRNYYIGTTTLALRRHLGRRRWSSGIHLLAQALIGRSLLPSRPVP